jgi:hypothetical protein
LIKNNINLRKRIFVLDGHCIERDNPKEKNSGECNPYPTAPGVGFSVRLVLWEAYDKVV